MMMRPGSLHLRQTDTSLPGAIRARLFALQLNTLRKPIGSPSRLLAPAYTRSSIPVVGTGNVFHSPPAAIRDYGGEPAHGPRLNLTSTWDRHVQLWETWV